LDAPPEGRMEDRWALDDIAELVGFHRDAHPAEVVRAVRAALAAPGVGTAAPAFDALTEARRYIAALVVERDELRVALAARAPQPPEPSGEHVYLSTSCLHGEHGYCASMTGMQGAKRPATCKFCGAKCQCRCHTAGEVS
jgi:hypothetical protein